VSANPALQVGRPTVPTQSLGAFVTYVLMAVGNDIKYLLKDGRRETEVRLSDDVGAAAAARLANRLAQVKGTSGGRIYINERCEFFGPVSTNDYSTFSTWETFTRTSGSPLRMATTAANEMDGLKCQLPSWLSLLADPTAHPQVPGPNGHRGWQMRCQLRM
jgi:hypothetical protein